MKKKNPLPDYYPASHKDNLMLQLPEKSKI